MLLLGLLPPLLPFVVAAGFFRVDNAPSMDTRLSRNDFFSFLR